MPRSTPNIGTPNESRGGNNLMLECSKKRKQLLEIIKGACGKPISLEKSPRGGYKIFDIKVFHIVDQGITATKLIVWVHGAFGESWMEGRQV